ncbi:PREDICTED: probable Xaa-Pro aminopeptidase 3 [Habropoda laboriosa]|uniref:probable Xaa-Pro aminopeptidase 3 n=1 Tax=Habropoda laboriosa TaxID=597456 RepID=UPI00083E2365|nr:PREDICTED: probable Xaa-Pro aminopeptidase 3 [Habropoda laboriosa]
MLSTVRNSIVFQIRKYGQQAYIRHSLDTVTNNVNRRQTEESSAILCRSCGQPTPLTHPHLMKDGEVVPGIQLYEFKKRRNKLMESIISRTSVTNLDKPQILIIPASSKVYMSGKIPYVFRQNTDFLYFTGCQEPDSILVITAKNENFLTTLFVPQQDEHSELWDGPRTGVDIAPKMFDVDSALPITEFEQFFLSFVNENKKCVIWYDSVNVAQPNLHKKLCELIKTTNGQTLASPTNLMHKIRLIKSQSEINLMKRSCQIISEAISKTIKISKPKMSEHHLFAIVDYECRMNDAEFLAYPPVVAAGKNANIIHYITNNQVIQDGDMVLMDAGCEYHGYSSDVTRTWPINGTFTQQQKILYDIVLDIQNILIDKLKELPSLDQLYHDMCSLLGKRLQEIGLIPKHFSRNELLSAVYTYCPHHVSHYLGMDVHDTGKISRSLKLQPGIIITLEPGIYVNHKNPLAPPEFHGLAVRVEDDILITENGPIILTENCPKGIAEIESLASQRL